MRGIDLNKPMKDPYKSKQKRFKEYEKEYLAAKQNARVKHKFLANLKN